MNTEVQTNNETHLFFESKEHYLKFKQAWKDYINGGNHEPPVYKRKHYADGGVREIAVKGKSSLSAFEHFLYNGLRQKDFYKSFAPITNAGRLNSRSSDHPYRAFYDCRYKLGDLISNFESTYDWTKKRAERKLIELNKIFGDTLTYEMLKDLHRYARNVELK
jgi:hypothetical protein